MNIFVVLTRTSARPKFFSECRKSVECLNTNDYTQIIHLVSYDDEETKNYLCEYPSLTLLKVEKQPRHVFEEFPYNLYFNEMIKYVSDNKEKIITSENDKIWITCLDDDDKYLDNNTFVYLSKLINEYFVNENDLILWRVKFPNRVVPSDRYFKKEIKKNNISAIGFCTMLETYNIHDLKWKGIKGGDYVIIDEISKKAKRTFWIDRVFNGVNYTAQDGGYGCRMDKKKKQYNTRELHSQFGTLKK